MNTYVELHRLMRMPVSLPVRGADGLAKRAFYGGVERQRLSSQSIKSHLRNATGLVRSGPADTLLPDDIGDLAERLGSSVSVRSAMIGERRIRPLLVQKGLSDDDAVIWADAVMALFRSGKEKEPAKPSSKGGKASKAGDDEPEETPPPADEAGRQIIVLGEAEIQALATLAAVAHAEGVKPAGLRDLASTAKRPAKGLPQALLDARDALMAMRSHVGLDGALFGRMATGIAVSRIDSAMHVAHALTVHPIQSVVDFFSAQDSLQDTDAGETGGAHINSRELTTGLFYLYAVIDVNQLGHNISGLTPGQRKDLVAWLVRAFATVTPAAMLGSTAPFTDPGEVLVTISNRQPISMMGAFERPCIPILEAASEALYQHADHVWSLAGRPRSVLRLSMHVEKGTTTTAVERLADAVALALD